TATLTPSQPLRPAAAYTWIVRGGAAEPRVKDRAGNALPYAATWSFTTGAATICPCSIWDQLVTPAVVDTADSGSVELGVRFQSDVAGLISGIRFYKSAGNLGPHTVSLWTTSGAVLARATGTAETAAGWQQVLFSTPVAIVSNT